MIIVSKTLTEKLLLKKIEGLRSELSELFNKKSKELGEAEILEKSQELDILLNEYNSN